jgi:hypothetical protein
LAPGPVRALVKRMQNSSAVSSGSEALPILRRVE